MAWITIGIDGERIPEVILRTSLSGVIHATLSDEQPYAEYNENNPGLDKYVFVTPLEPGENFFVVVIQDISSRAVSLIKKSVQLVGCEGTITVAVGFPVVVPLVFKMFV